MCILAGHNNYSTTKSKNMFKHNLLNTHLYHFCVFFNIVLFNLVETYLVETLVLLMFWFDCLDPSFTNSAGTAAEDGLGSSLVTPFCGCTGRVHSSVWSTWSLSVFCLVYLCCSWAVGGPPLRPLDHREAKQNVAL